MQAKMRYTRGIFLLDIEVELAWGFMHGRFDKDRMTRASNIVRENLDEILSLLGKYQIPVTWGVLGHVALDHCECANLPHSEMPRASYHWLKGDWFELDPCATLDDEPAFYGKDIVDRVVDFASKSTVTHDIACHSFSHQLFGDPGCSEEVAEAEIEECIRIMQENYNLRPRVFIFPRDYPGHLEVLERNGFIAFRGRIPYAINYREVATGIRDTLVRLISLASYAASFYFRVPPPVVQHFDESGLVNVPGSMCYNKKSSIPLNLVKTKALKGIERAVEENLIFHLYSHLINFGQAPDTKAFMRSFEEILALADLFRSKNKLEITTMKELVECGHHD